MDLPAYGHRYKLMLARDRHLDGQGDWQGKNMMRRCGLV